MISTFRPSRIISQKSAHPNTESPSHRQKGFRGQMSELTEGVVELVAEELEQVALDIQRHRERGEHRNVDKQPKLRDPVEIAVCVAGPALNVGLRDQVRGPARTLLTRTDPRDEYPPKEKYGAEDVWETDQARRCQARAPF